MKSPLLYHFGSLIRNYLSDLIEITITITPYYPFSKVILGALIVVSHEK